MAFFSSRKQQFTAVINGQSIAVDPRETLLQAALRQGIDFPNSCRVGGCATCKCRLAAGRVKEMTETGYILSKDEIEQGYILACQSVPRSDVRVDGRIGFRVGKDLNLHITTLNVTRKLAPVPVKKG